MKRLFLALVFLAPAYILPAQVLMFGVSIGPGASKLEPRPTSGFTGMERFPSFIFGVNSELVFKSSPISGRLSYWFEYAGEEERPVGVMTIPLMLKATFGKKWRPYAMGGLAGCYVFERSHRYQTSDFSSIYGAGIERELNSGNYLFVEYVHLAGISSVYDELMNAPGGTEELIENYHIRQYVNFGAMFYLGGRKVYIKRKLRRE